MTGKVKVGVAIAAPIFALISLGTTLWLYRPFQVELASYRTSLADRTEAQRHNILQAAKALDGVVIEPGETFSFNKMVGPRTPERGYQEAPAFMERDLVKSIGGGVCQVSSTVYNAAALAGLTVIERHPHVRFVSSVPPGRDATVWYGLVDLRATNPFSTPVQLLLDTDGETLNVAIQGKSRQFSKVSILTEPQLHSKQGERLLQTLRVFEEPGVESYYEVLSLDVYKVQ